MSVANLEELWAVYANDTRPPNIGDRVGGVELGELDDAVQDIVGTYMGMGAELDAWRVARLGIALAEITRVLPDIEPAATRGYFVRLADLARAALESISARKA